MPLKLTTIQQAVLFFILAFLISWGAWIPAFSNPALPSQIIFIGLFGPALSAIITIWLVGGTAGVRALFGKFLRWRFAAYWYLAAVFIMPLLFLIGVLASAFISSTSPVLWTGSPVYFILGAFVFLMVINSGEEIGWRGLALPLLQDIFHNDLLAGLILGVIWAIWHLPTYLIAGQSSFPFIIFAFFITGLSLLYVALFRNSQQSLLAAVLLHAGTDIVPRFMQMAEFKVLTYVMVTALVWAAAFLLNWHQIFHKGTGQAVQG